MPIMRVNSGHPQKSDCPLILSHERVVRYCIGLVHEDRSNRFVADRPDIASGAPDRIRHIGLLVELFRAERSRRRVAERTPAQQGLSSAAVKVATREECRVVDAENAPP